MNQELTFALLDQLDASFTQHQPEPPLGIADPWHSRPIDVHRWSEHPEVKAIVADIWTKYFPQLVNAQSRSGPKPKTSFKYQLRVLILDLYVAWLEDPALCIGVAMSANYWDTTSRYNALKISKQIIPLIHRLHALGLLDLAKGSYGGPWARGNRTTRIRASEALQAVFAEAGVKRDDIGKIETEECIILKDGSELGDGTKLHDYEDTDTTNRMRTELRAYNKVLANTFIDIPELEVAVIEHTVTAGKDTGRTATQRLVHHQQFVRRVFSRGSWDLNGRFYGPWWQQIGSDWRRRIYINDTPTVEVDFKGLHIAILSAEKGVVIDGDPYALPDGVVAGVPAGLQRKLVKQLVLTALNAKERKSAFQSFRDGFPAQHMAKALTNDQLDLVLAAFVEKHPHLAELVCADQGIRLMNVDAQIAEQVHRYFTRRGIPVLSVHDSFIVDYTRVQLLKRVMRAASKAVVGRPLEMSQSALGLDEMQSDGDVEVVADFIGWSQAPRSDGYCQRLANFEARSGTKVVPFDRV